MPPSSFPSIGVELRVGPVTKKLTLWAAKGCSQPASPALSRGAHLQGWLGGAAGLARTLKRSKMAALPLIKWIAAAAVEHEEKGREAEPFDGPADAESGVGACFSHADE